LVALTLHDEDKKKFSALAGVSVNSIVINKKQSFSENILFTHRGISGPAILQISSYWRPGEEIIINLVPPIDLIGCIKLAQKTQPQKQLNTFLSLYLPKKLIELFLGKNILDKKLYLLTNIEITKVAAQINTWSLRPNGTEGYRTAEVTLGGVDCDAISSKTMESYTTENLYFIGEVLDVTGWLGGYNFQWAWSSGWAAGQVV
jgi:predicted Rossmann fold flavoprotein